jgi:uncharacterized membrane protein
VNGYLLRLHRDERGQAMVLVAIFLLGLVAVAGLVADGGMVLTQRRDLQNVADAAAAAGAMQLDESAYRAASGQEVSLDRSAAYSAAVSYLAAESGIDYLVTADSTSVEIVVSRGAETAFLRVLGIDSVTISARAAAEPRHGVLTAAP